PPSTIVSRSFLPHRITSKTLGLILSDSMDESWHSSRPTASIRQIIPLGIGIFTVTHRLSGVDAYRREPRRSEAHHQYRQRQQQNRPGNHDHAPTWLVIVRNIGDQ